MQRILNLRLPNGEFTLCKFITKLPSRRLHRKIYSLKSEVFTRASQEISRLFPNEAQEVYFTPYTKSSSNLRKQAPRGKLWSRYIHVKAGLRLAEKFSNNYKSEEHASLLTEPSEEVISSLKLLESDATDFPRLLLVWKATFEERRDFILKEDIGTEYTYKVSNIENPERYSVVRI